MDSIPFGDSTVAVLQAVNQYTTGLVGGYLIDQLMDSWQVDESNVVARSVRQLLQVGLNGLALNFMLKALHGTTPGLGYRDPSGGYLLVIGLIQSQQTFMKNGKDLVRGLTMFIKDVLIPHSTAGPTPEVRNLPE